MERIPTRTTHFWTTHELLANPHIGFCTFQRFNGDALNPLAGRGWTEGHPIVYQPFGGSLKNESHPDSTVAYFRLYWRYFEEKEGQYNFELFDRAIATAHERGQTLMIRLAPTATSRPWTSPTGCALALGLTSAATTRRSASTPTTSAATPPPSAPWRRATTPTPAWTASIYRSAAPGARGRAPTK